MSASVAVLCGHVLAALATASPCSSPLRRAAETLVAIRLPARAPTTTAGAINFRILCMPSVTPDLALLGSDRSQSGGHGVAHRADQHLGAELDVVTRAQQ